MKQKHKILFLFSTLLFASAFFSFCYGQKKSVDEQLAAQYYQNKEYSKAVVYYARLYENNPTEIYYNYYTDCLIQTKDYKKAEKVIKKQIRQHPDKLTYIVDLGRVYQIDNNPKKAKQEFKNAIKKLGPSQQQILNLGTAFVKIKDWEHAIDTYKRGRKLLKGDYPFNFELADVYKAEGDIVSMVNEYLDALEISNSYIQSVQNALQMEFGPGADKAKNQVIKNELVKRIQREPNKKIFSDLLIWIFIQEKDFNSALTQSEALDKREKGKGTRVMSLASVCVSNDAYDVAVKAYQYVIDLGPSSYNYTDARLGQLDILYKQLIERHDYTTQDLLNLKKKFQAALDELGESANTIKLMRKMAHLEAFYLHDDQSAINILNEAISIPGVQPAIQAKCKLALGDIMLLDGQIWNASLIYSQVEHDFKENPIGDEAKFKNAEISFYNGDFKWAKAQLDVLSASTAKLISNDAMALSLLIMDNTTMDTNTVPLKMYADAELLAYQNKDAEAFAKMNSIDSMFPTTSLASRILFEKAQIRKKEGKYAEAAGFYQKLVSNYSTDVLADKALFQLADMYQHQLNNKDKAMDLYKKILEDYPGSFYVTEARKRFREMRGDAVVN